MAQNYSETEMAAHLTQVRCKRFDMQTAPGTGDKEMTVYWEVSHNKVAEAVAFLDKYGVPENHTAGTVTQLLTDPVVDNEPYAGKWRVVRNWFDPQISGKVFQTRRYGWLTTLLGTGGAIDWTEAKIVSGRDHLVYSTATAVTDDYLVLEWRNIKPGSGPALAKELVTLAATTTTLTFTPLGDETTCGTGWRVLPVSHQTAQDGSSVLMATFVKLGITETGYGNIGGDQTEEVITERVTDDAMQARVETLKVKAATSNSTSHIRITDVTPSRGSDGIATIRYTKRTAKLGVVETAYGNIGSEVETETYTERVLESGMTARVKTLKDAGTYSDVVPSRGSDGVATIRYTKIVPKPGAVYYMTIPETGQTEYHKIAWEQTSADLDWDGTADWDNNPLTPATTPAITYRLRRVAGVRRNPQTNKLSYHVVISDGGEQIPTADHATAPTNALVTYRSQFFERRMWSILNNMYWDQRKITVWKYETLIFTTYAAANAWMGANTATNPSYFYDGEPVWTGTAPNLPPQEGTAPPRLIGVNKWLAQRRTVSWDSGYYPPEPT